VLHIAVGLFHAYRMKQKFFVFEHIVNHSLLL
jgi:hypothetical protein